MFCMCCSKVCLLMHSTKKMSKSLNIIEFFETSKINSRWYEMKNLNFPEIKQFPIESHTAPWLFTPTIELDLTTFPKSQNNIRCELIANVSNEYSDHIICYTDGFKANSKTGYALSIQDLIVSNRLNVRDER